MSMISWKNQLLENLRERDALQKSASDENDAFKSIQLLTQRLNDMQIRQKLLEHKDTESEVLAKKLTEFETLRELNNKYKETINDDKVKLKTLDNNLKESQKVIDSMNDSYQQLHDKFVRFKEESVARNKSLEIVNDDLLSLQIENNLLNDRISKLSKENDQLIKRWMDKVSKDAETLNDINELLGSSSNHT
ncbi:unnamed protein product [[Candida] boidinii]|uniref:Unnamed protein product n=1 Tax=Candida boidinii TaxID=5477 RepID=A0A9W6SYD6_CANBO|nr:hypothetical protein B5S30_g5574 [[Candida] boidinii]GME69783.1 unnamed protein product [[Candida] boidinii]GMF56604.1 unnamed protein product [[Candida] boidinii]GMF99667.1 unnamed protein product [[Candida] boidinii]